MDSDSGAAPSVAWDGDVHEPPLGKELPQRGGAGVTEDNVRGQASTAAIHLPFSLSPWCPTAYTPR